MPSRTLLVLSIVALLAAGCGERPEPVGGLAQVYPVRVQGATDEPTVLKQRPERIVALDAGPAEIVIELGEGSRLVGVPAGIEEGSGTRGSARVTRPTGQISIETVARLEPDLILATPETDPLGLARAARETGAAVYVQPSASVDDVKRGVVELGFLLGREPEARRSVARIERAVGRVEARLEGAAPVSVFVDTGFFIAVPEQSLVGDLVKRAAGTNVAGETPGPDPLSPREIARADPEIYLMLSDSDVTLKSLRRDPRASTIEAIREGRFAVLPVRLVERPGPRIGAALEAVARALHPDAFA